MIDIAMPVYNSERFIYESVNSILNQTFENFRLLVFNDGSTDRTKEILHSFRDKRIVYFESKQNISTSNALNTLMRFSDAKYIARMDADDIALPKRLAVQLDFLENNPEYVLCGSWFRTFGYGQTEQTIYTPQDSEEIRVSLLANSCIGHPTVMFRNGLFTYDGMYEHAEDYNAWADLSKNKNNLMTNIPEVLFRYRLHPQQVSSSKRNQQFETANKIREKLLKNLSTDFTEREVNIFFFLMTAHCENFNFSLNEIQCLIDKIIKINHSSNLYNHQILEQNLQYQLKIILHQYKADFKNLSNRKEKDFSDFIENVPTTALPSTSSRLPKSDVAANTVVPKTSGINCWGNPLPIYHRMCSMASPIKVLEQSSPDDLFSDSQTQETLLGQARESSEIGRRERYFEAYNRFSKVKSVADYINILEWYRQQKAYVENLLSTGQLLERENLKLELLEWGRVEQEIIWIIEKRRIPKTLVSVRPGPPKCS